jgi:hypothetical protein
MLHLHENLHINMVCFSGTDEKALRKASDVNMLVELCSEKKAASGGGTEKFVTIIPRFKLRYCLILLS